MKNSFDDLRVFDHSLKEILYDELHKSGYPTGSLNTALTQLKLADRIRMRRILARYSKACQHDVLCLQKQLTLSLLSGLRAFGSALLRGGAAGISVAGILNTLAPNLFSATLGYLAGALRGTSTAKLLSKLGLLSVAAFSPPTFTHAAILVLGGLLGIILYAVYSPIKHLIIKALHQKRRVPPPKPR